MAARPSKISCHQPARQTFWWQSFPLAVAEMLMITMTTHLRGAFQAASSPLGAVHGEIQEESFRNTDAGRIPRLLAMKNLLIDLALQHAIHQRHTAKAVPATVLSNAGYWLSARWASNQVVAVRTDRLTRPHCPSHWLQSSSGHAAIH
ncbi:androgen-dependent TFPI-regulating protein isoform X2 [Hippopotamus amphibius kiboko]|uniref:androgen-dependent TFPI-regulating protein isoform X2 n=1 Tax=Hippopotamus amphibius kiboko TaxID=575201 RepID=UPI002598790A|nr:androgen-dependent TFPI-regulating protein isoform X2 [Hippopotamus amphibius kiboko]